MSLFVTLDADSPRIGWDVSVDNRAQDHRLRLLFPVGVEAIAEVRAETAFGAVRRPARREVPAEIRNEVPVSYAPTISFTEAGGDRAGVVLFGEGLMEYEAIPGEDGRSARLALTLLRCVGFLSREDLAMRPSGHAGPGLPTPGAQCPGRHTFRLAFEPRGDAPAASALFARAASFVAPPMVVPAAGPGGALPPQHAFLRIDARRGGAVLSACCRSEEREGLLVRLFNPDEKPVSINLTPAMDLHQAWRVDFLENRLEELAVRQGAVEVALGPHRIATIELAGR